jgi:hypothetical protein
MAKNDEKCEFLGEKWRNMAQKSHKKHSLNLKNTQNYFKNTSKHPKISKNTSKTLKKRQKNGIYR